MLSTRAKALIGVTLAVLWLTPDAVLVRLILLFVPALQFQHGVALCCSAAAHAPLHLSLVRPLWLP